MKASQGLIQTYVIAYRVVAGFYSAAISIVANTVAWTRAETGRGEAT